MFRQQRLIGKDVQLKEPYSYGAYDKSNDVEQWIRISEGCVHNCPFCYEPTELKWFEVPKIIRNKVKIMDMNLLCKDGALTCIEALGEIRVRGRVVYYELICGVDHRFLTQEIANALKLSRFQRIRLAWDWTLFDQYKIKDSLKMLVRAGYKPNDIMIFILCNWRITFKENLRKLDVCKVWNVKVCDCYFDGQTSPNINPIFWTSEQIKKFRKETRIHNILVNFRCYPQ